jgi:hypothetical protein
MSADLFGVEMRPTKAYGAHESSSGGTDQWLTPPELLARLGDFDLDPCAPISRPWPTAQRHFTIQDDGLKQQWSGRVWLNPPYANAAIWMRRMVEHGNGTALLFARTETAMWHDWVWPKASALLFIKGRLSFYTSEGRRGRSNAGAPSALIAYGERDKQILKASQIDGAFVEIGGGR